MKEIIVTEEDVRLFKFTSNKKIKIYQFWKEIISLMPRKLRMEVRTKATSIVELEQSNPQKIYKFKTQNASLDLEVFLNNFIIKQN
jgi:hypothetical protein